MSHHPLRRTLVTRPRRAGKSNLLRELYPDVSPFVRRPTQLDRFNDWPQALSAALDLRHETGVKHRVTRERFEHLGRRWWVLEPVVMRRDMLALERGLLDQLAAGRDLTGWRP